MRRLVIEEPVSQAARWSGRLALFALTVLCMGVLAARLGQHDAASLAPIAASFLLAALAFGLALAAAVFIWQTGARGAGIAGVSGLLALGLLAPAGYLAAQFVLLPPLADISTDIEQPPAFSRSRATLEARGGRVPPELPREAREAQRTAYDGLAPIVTDLPVEDSYRIALDAAAGLGWRIVERQPPGGRTGTARIEAIAIGRVLRFPDDVTIRVRPRVDGSRIDIRSASRLGRHDFGANARRIRAFIDEVELRMSER